NRAFAMSHPPPSRSWPVQGRDGPVDRPAMRFIRERGPRRIGRHPDRSRRRVAWTNRFADETDQEKGTLLVEESCGSLVRDLLIGAPQRADDLAPEAGFFEDLAAQAILRRLVGFKAPARQKQAPSLLDDEDVLDPIEHDAVGTRSRRIRATGPCFAELR